ncbi:MAG: NAD-dependent deacylase [Pseudomonadota bacterium]
MDDLIARAAAHIARSKRVVALTGAGISVESGIPPFRGKGGVWESIDPMEFAHIDAFMRDPAKVWRVLIMAMKACLDEARPNAGHTGLAALETLGHLKTVITQNVDGLHQVAGSTDVIEFHGTFAVLRCLDCSTQTSMRDIRFEAMPPRCGCGGVLRPDCIFFGEMIPPETLARSQAVAAACEVMLVVGTSAVVQPAALMPVIARDNGAVVIEINPESTPLTRSVSDFLIPGTGGAVMARLAQAVSAVT